MIYSLHRFGFRFDEYFLFQLQNKNTRGRNNFISDKIRYAYAEILNNRDNFSIFRDKDKTFNVFKDFYKRDFLHIKDKTSKSGFLSFIDKHKVFMKKPTSMDSGKGIEVLSLDNFRNAEDLFNKLIEASPCVIEEIIINSDQVKKLSPTALSTVRVPTILLKSQEETEVNVEIFTPFVRLGRKAQIVDNYGKGGIIATVDPTTGTIVSPGYTQSNLKYLFHPDTNEQIIGFTIPQWEELIQIVKQVAIIIPSVKYASWDFAHTDRGWVMIEANYNGATTPLQFPDMTGKRKWLEGLIMQ